MFAMFFRRPARCLLMLCLLTSGLVGSAHAAFPDAVDGQPLPSLAPMLERVMPAVVNISTRGPMPRRNPLMDDPFFQRYFGIAPEEAPSQSLGSGVIIDAAEGLVITNNHVIDNAVHILVTLNDGRDVDATLVGTDPEADVALVRIEAEGLTQLEWADSSALRVGDFSVAIGNPFGLGQTVTSGIVSALGRSGLGIENFEDFIQTDASINPGNSGGALVNLRGELIGINTAIVGPSGGNVGIGFAIPANMAADITEQLLEFGEVRRGALGIAAQPLTPELAEAFGVDSRFGVVIGRVQTGSPAEKSGLLAGDVITAIDGRPVRDVRAVRNRIGLVRLGEQLQLDITRNKRPQSVTVTVEALPVTNPLAAGARLQERESRNGRRYVVIEAVRSGSVLDRAGLQAGDIVLSINRQGVGTVADIERIADQSGDELLLLIQRGRSTSYVTIPNT
ncbi:DegQ family serine endoprotease [Granulosicoccus sp. 3-233]|uniref:DegQ family serine endoprotease n=1 Tax=Granulosicoccus sp. 3-233 TaxID=3417969 RepID=UPI003D33AD05